ncbi:amino acid adenylation domain-containing protein, partial [Actinocrinis puniceicyclus]
FFVNTVVLRTDLSGDPSFVQVLERVRAVVLGALSHQDAPFDQVVERLNPVRDASTSPLFQVMFTTDGNADGAARAVALRGLESEPYPAGAEGAQVDLTLGLREGPDGLAGELEYNADLFDRNTVERLAGHLGDLLEQIAARPHDRIGEYAMAAAGEQRVIGLWNNTRRSYNTRTGVEQHFEQYADRTPGAPCVVWEGQELSYADVERRANQMAHLLRAHGVGPEDRVAVCLSRGPDTVVAPLAVLKAGAAFLPMDPEQPRARLAAMLADADPIVLLCDSAVAGRVPEGPWRQIVLDDPADPAGLARQPAHRPERDVPPSALAYIIHTSGSTGTPKGVMVTRGGFANFRESWAAWTRPETLDRWLTVTSPAFDAFLGDLVRSVTFGGCLLLGDRALALAPDLLAARLAEERIVAFDTVPAVLANLVGHLAESGLTLPDLKLLIVGADSFGIGDCEAALSVLGPRTRVVNAWGATETSIDSTLFETRPGVETVSGVVPIGGPVANTAVYVLDERGRPAPIGVPGELYVGGQGVARGYAGRAALTADRFVPDPLGSEPGARLYRTGDRGRWLPGGVVEFLGRGDDQVQIRGHRVEPGEIEAVLRSHPDVAQSYILPVRDGIAVHKLVAYVTPSPGRTLDHDALRRHVDESLPAYMRVSAFVVLDRLPRTLSGKVDRAALPKPSADSAESVSSGAAAGPATSKVLPRDPTEQALAEVWQQVLGLDAQIGVHEDFFDLGGHSLLATRVVFAVRKALGVEIPVHTVFDAPTVAALAARLGAAARTGRTQQADVEPADRGGPLALSFAQERLHFLWRMAPESPAYNAPIALRLRGTLCAESLIAALSGAVARHEVLRTRYVDGDQGPQQVIDPASRIAPARVDADEADLPRLLHDEWARPFDLAGGPVLRATLFRISDAEHVLLLVLHHIAYDGWSDAILWQEIVAGYRAALRGETSDLSQPAELPEVPEVPEFPELPELPLQYADFASWQRKQSADGQFAGQLDYWERQLAEVPALELPTDRPRPAAPSYAADRILLDVPEDLVQRLRSLAQTTGTTPFMVLLAAFQVLLGRVSGSRDVA